MKHREKLIDPSTLLLVFVIVYVATVAICFIIGGNPHI